MKNDKAEHLLVRIGNILAEDKHYPLDNTLLHAKLDYNMVSPSIFKNLDTEILYRDADLRRLGDALLDLWEAQETNGRWEEMEYVIRNGTFEVTYTYPDEIDPKEDWNERRERVVRRHFGDKPIVFPPWEDDDDVDYDL